MLGTIITAVVTPFATDMSIDEEAFVGLLHHLHEHGSDGVVVCGTTGEASTLSTEEHMAVVELAVRERPAGMTVTAGVGSNDTAHAVEMTERACEIGVDGLLSVNPYYNRPSRRGIIEHFTRVAAAADRPIVLYNIPGRTGADMDNELLAELGQLDHICAVKQANNDNLAMIDGLDLYAGNDDILARVLDMGGAGGILTASHIVGPRMRAIADEPENRAAIHAELAPVFETLAIAPAAVSNKAALNLLGIPAGTVRLPYVELDDEETERIRGLLVSLGLLEGAAR